MHLFSYLSEKFDNFVGALSTDSRVNCIHNHNHCLPLVAVLGTVLILLPSTKFHHESAIAMLWIAEMFFYISFLNPYFLIKMTFYRYAMSKNRPFQKSISSIWWSANRLIPCDWRLPKDPWAVINFQQGVTSSFDFSWRKERAISTYLRRSHNGLSLNYNLCAWTSARAENGNNSS